MGLRRLLRFLGGGLLRLAVVENHGTIWRARIRALAVERRGVVRLPERLKELLVRDLFRVERNLRHLGVAACAGADLFVSGIGQLAAGVAAGHGLDALQPLEDGFDAPETAA